MASRTYTLTHEIQTTLAGDLGVLVSQPIANDKPSLKDLLGVLAELCFIAETVAHLQAKEHIILPTTDRARAMIEQLQPSTHTIKD